MVFLYDIDGTLILTGGAGSRALARAVLELHGLEQALHGVPLDGKTDPLIVREIFAKLGRAPTDAEHDALIERYIDHLRREMEDRARYRVLPGVESAIAACEALGALVGLATGNVKRGAQLKLEPGDLWRRFDFGGFGCDAADRGELVACAVRRAEELAGQPVPRDEVFVIGDTPRDVAAAHANGLVAIAVPTGSHPRDALEASGADVVFDTLEELPQWLAGATSSRTR